MKQSKCQKLTRAMLSGCPPMMYQTLEKKHVDPDNTATASQWEDFLDNMQDVFAEETSELASELFEEWETSMKVD